MKGGYIYISDGGHIYFLSHGSTAAIEITWLICWYQCHIMISAAKIDPKNYEPYIARDQTVAD